MRAPCPCRKRRIRRERADRNAAVGGYCARKRSVLLLVLPVLVGNSDPDVLVMQSTEERAGFRACWRWKPRPRGGLADYAIGNSPVQT